MSTIISVEAAAVAGTVVTLLVFGLWALGRAAGARA